MPLPTVAYPLNNGKLHRPHLTGEAIPRPRLFRELDLLAPLTVIVAPAGYGKTTLVSTWLQTRQYPSAWLALDADDSNLYQFLIYLTTAIRQQFPDFGAEIGELLAASELPSLRTITRVLAKALDQIDQEFVIVLEDYHVIDTPAIHALLVELLHHPPQHLHLVITARRSPPLTLASARAYGKLVEIRASSLLFSEQETRQLLAELAPQLADEKTAASLNQNAQGWAASLQLAILYLRQQPDAVFQPDLFDGGASFAMDYLANEVVAQLAPALQTFLCETSLLERLHADACAALCAAAITPAAAQANLDWLEANDIFTVALDEEGKWFQYHPLFRQMLQQRLRQSASPAQIAALHRRTSRWFAAQGQVTEALRHALAAGDARDAARLLAAVRVDLMNRDEWQQLERWLHLLDDALVEEYPELLLTRTWIAHSRYDLARVQALERRVTARLADLRTDATPYQGRYDQAALDALEGETAILRTYLSYWSGDWAGVRRHCEVALSQTPLALWSARNVAIVFCSGAHQVMGELAQAYAVFDAQIRLVGAYGATAQQRLLIAKCHIFSIAGDLRSLAKTVAAARSLNHEPAWTSYEAWLRYFSATVAYYHNDLPGAEQALAELMPRRYQATPHCFVQSVCVLAMTYQAQGRPTAANDLVTQALAHLQDMGNAITAAQLRAFQADLALRQGRPEEAQFLALELSQESFPPMPFFYTPHMTLVRLHLQRNTAASRRAAFTLLERLDQHLSQAHNNRALLEVWALKTRFWQLQGDEVQTLVAMERAIHLAQQGAFLRTFLDLGAPLAGLLAQLEARGVAPILIAALQASMPAEPAAEPVDGVQAEDDLTVLLTFREQDVLRLLGERLSNREIADTLQISPDTVKRHTANIFRKLQVTNRRAAAWRAREYALAAQRGHS
jgi:LuxR family maltose regulon positive regulatory protein